MVVLDTEAQDSMNNMKQLDDHIRLHREEG